MSAAIYDAETGDTITEGLQGCHVCDEAIQTARRIAAERDEPVHLTDDDGEWLVKPDGSRDKVSDSGRSRVSGAMSDSTLRDMVKAATRRADHLAETNNCEHCAKLTTVLAAVSDILNHPVRAERDQELDRLHAATSEAWEALLQMRQRQRDDR